MNELMFIKKKTLFKGRLLRSIKEKLTKLGSFLSCPNQRSREIHALILPTKKSELLLKRHKSLVKQEQRRKV